MRVTGARAVAVLAGALLAAGCSSPAASSGASPAAPTVQHVAAEIGATGVSVMSPTLYASAEGTATWHGQQVDIATFATDALRDKWEAVVKQFGPVLKDGPGWAMTTG